MYNLQILAGATEDSKRFLQESEDTRRQSSMKHEQYKNEFNRGNWLKKPLKED